MKRNCFHKLIQAVKTGGLIYAVQKVWLYVKRKIKTERRFSWVDYAFEELLEPIGKILEYKFDVSVVIPAYNGGLQFEKLLELLEKQEGCGSVETVVVDSGSTDGTVELCRKHGVTLVQITQEEFSHSYARNLGAEKAAGELIVFMTQDALPSSEKWLSQLLAPILTGEADAVSCREECPEGTDLYYQIASYGHESFVGFLKEDVTGSREKCRDKESLRRYASLSDVACAIRRDVFLKFRHRYNFAEDLDLGIRLLSCGYKTKLLAKTKVIHCHSRDADYYLKRAVVEQEAFSKIFPEEKGKESPDMVASRIYYSACLVAEYLEALGRLESSAEKNKEGGSGMSVSRFVRQADALFGEMMKNTMKQTGSRKSNCGVLEKSFFDSLTCGSAPLLEKVVGLCAENHKLKKHPSNTDLAYSVRFYLDNVAEYFAYRGMPDAVLPVETLCGCMLKQFALCTGTELAKLKKEEKWAPVVLELIKGV